MLKLQWEIKQPFPWQMIIPSGGRWSRLQLLQVIPKSLNPSLLAQAWQAKGEWFLLWRLSSWTIPVSSSSGNWRSVPSKPLYQLIICLPNSSPASLRTTFHSLCHFLLPTDPASTRLVCVTWPLPALQPHPGFMFLFTADTPAHWSSFSSSKHIKLLPTSGPLPILPPLPEIIGSPYASA